VTAVSDVDLALQLGTIHGLIGPNGAGKSSIIDAITGFVTPRSGTIFLMGKAVKHGMGAHHRARLGLIRSFQHLELFDDLTVSENLSASARASRRGNAATIAFAVELLGLQSVLSAKVTELAHGARRLVSVARAICAAPMVLVLDEPATGLEAGEIRHLGGCLRQVADLNIAVLLVDHDMSLVLSVSDTVTALDGGRRIAAGSPADIRANEHVRLAYLG
jgi:branched-chain amino acid transport system ATP-binding protein